MAYTKVWEMAFRMNEKTSCSWHSIALLIEIGQGRILKIRTSQEFYRVI